MYRSSLARARQSYRHEAFLWRDASHFSKQLVPFVEEGLAAGEPVMVVLIEEHADWLRAGLGSQADEVQFVNMAEVGRNPARIIPAWQQFVDAHAGDGPVRGIGEPIWVGRREEEILECQLHEALLNLALDPQTPFWLICPYEAERLPTHVLSEVDRSHHAILDEHSFRGSTVYGGRPYVDLLFSASLPALPAPDMERTFTAANLSDVFAAVVADAYCSDLWSDQILSLAAAARRLAEGSIRRGADEGTVRVWDRPRALVCEVSDSTVLNDALVGRRRLAVEGDHGLWCVNEVCDLVQLRSGSSGTTVRLYAWKDLPERFSRRLPGRAYSY